nr:MAG TPA: Receptor Binding Protein sandwich domain, phage receptor [Caudoviricetes sp.]
MELVTGFAGQAHVDPIDMAHLNAVAFGHDAYLLDTQNKLEPTLETANKLVVDTGDLMIQGHHFTVVQSEEIALQSGVSGQKRNALVCARYDKASGTGIETASWVVKYGTATTGTPADPSVTTGNILDGVDSVHEEPIFRIEYDGITPGDPILLVPEFQSAADYRDSISPDSHLTSWGSSEVLFEKSGGIVVCSGQVETTISAWTNKLICNIPEGFRPARDRVRGTFANNTANGVMNAYGSDGEYPNQLYAMPFGQAVTANSIVFNMSWVTAM